MKLINKIYRYLRPSYELLTDEVVIAQAWKKSHSYIRSHNWYADTLALDISALGLEENVKLWSNPNQKYELRDLELVLAGKSEVWHFNDEKKWAPKNKDEERNNSLRPLAHILIREQTWATALMMCLADAVETVQGDCSERDFEKAQEKKIYSYGNRLLCDWQGKSAWFRWGNGESYRKFFTDYQNFLNRPVEIGRSLSNSHAQADNIYIVSLDIKKFYDNIHRDVLLDRLKEISKKFSHKEPDPKFWKAASSITDWKWRKEDISKVKNLGLTDGMGLPQGLVASGFFANAYLVDFDQKIGSYLGKNISPNSNITLHDYCRYVDDLRFVVTAEDSEPNHIKSILNKWVSSILGKSGGKELILNREKSRVTSLSDLDNSGSLSGKITAIQSELSGPADRGILENSMGMLEALLSVQSDDLPELKLTDQDADLLKIAKFDSDIRPDTLKRFAANRLEGVIRNKRKLEVESHPELGDEFDPLPDNESELLAKKLVWTWMQDPSLALVLRKAFEIFPSPELAEPILKAIYDRSSMGSGGNGQYTPAMMDYLLSDIFRNAVDFNGLFQIGSYPSSSDPHGLLDLVASFAQKVIVHVDAPDLVKRQALLILAVLQKPILIENPDNNIQNNLHAILSGKLPVHHRQLIALYEVAAQISGKLQSTATTLITSLENLTDQEEVYWSLEPFAKKGGEFWKEIWRKLKKSKISKDTLGRLKWAAPLKVGTPKSNNQKLSFIISSNMNGFEHEAGALKLALGLIDYIEEHGKFEELSPSSITVQQHGWNGSWEELWSPSVEKISCKKVRGSDILDPRFKIPNWISEEMPDARKFYWLGAMLRAAVAGSSDFTSNRIQAGEIQNYKGLKSGWYKRRMGLMHSPEALVGEFATVSNWFVELIMMCLQWPGFEASYIQSDDIKEIEDISSLKAILHKRLLILDSLYCEASRMPALITKVTRPFSEHKKFRVVTVQSLLPRTSAFSSADPTLSNVRTKAINRDHLSRVCSLTYKTLIAKLAAEGRTDQVAANLIVFPEVAIHPEDIDLIKRLSDKTRSMIFAGIIFVDHLGKLINHAKWFIPDYRDTGRRWIIRDQGKKHLTEVEIPFGIQSYRPCQHIIEVVGDDEGPFSLTGAVCYDATDLKLAADLTGKTDLFVICAHNKDVRTFDAMASALHYHMYQHVVVVNKGEFGGTTIQAPYKEQFDKLISHVHGTEQISINIADLDLAAFKRNTEKLKEVKTKPAGI